MRKIGKKKKYRHWMLILREEGKVSHATRGLLKNTAKIFGVGMQLFNDDIFSVSAQEINLEGTGNLQYTAFQEVK